MAKKPDNVAECLYAVADYLDLVDELITNHAQSQGKEIELGNEVQQDLRAIAELLENDPRIDDQIWNKLPSLHAWNLPSEEEAQANG